MTPARRRAAAALIRRGDFDGASTAVFGAPLGLDALLRNDPGHDLLYSVPPRGTPPSEKLAAAFEKNAGRSAESWTLLGAARLSAGRRADAEKALDRALRLDPGLTPARLLRAAAVLHAQSMSRDNTRLPQALDDAEAAAATGDPRALRLRAELRVDFDDFAGARADLEALLAADPGDAWARVEYADLLGDHAEHRKALELVDGIRGARDRGWWWAARGRVLALGGRSREAIACLKKAAKILPRSGVIEAWIGEIHRRAARYRQALACFDRAARLEPSFVYTHEWRGRLLLMLGRTRRALIDLDAFTAADPRHRYGPALRGEALFKLGRGEEAIREFDRVPRLDPRGTWNPVVREGRSTTPAVREATLWRDLADARLRRPKDWTVPLLAGRFQAASGESARALEDLELALRLAPTREARADALAWLGRMRLDLGDANEAERRLSAALRERPDHRRARAWRGEARAALGHDEAARRDFKRACSGAGAEFAFVWAALGRLEASRGRWKEAARSLRVALCLDVKDRAVRELYRNAARRARDNKERAAA